MRKIVFLLSVLIMAMGMKETAVAAETYSVSTKEYSLKKGEEATIPVMIDNNEGIMGFKVMLDYDSSLVKVKSIEKGALTGKGTFAHNTGLKSNHVDIIWSNTENVSGAGSLFLVGVEMQSMEKSEANIHISYSQPDTFNEYYQDVKLNCHDIKITVAGGENGSLEEDEPDIGKQNDKIKEAVNKTLSNLGYEKLSDVKDEEEFVREYNRQIQHSTDTDIYSISSIEDIKEVYEYRDESPIEIAAGTEKAPEKEQVTSRDHRIEYMVVILLVLMLALGSAILIRRKRKK